MQWEKTRAYGGQDGSGTSVSSACGIAIITVKGATQSASTSAGKTG